MSVPLAPGSFRPVGASDPYFSSVVLLCHLDGSNGSTTITDVKGHTVTAGGNAQLSTAQKKFGTASLSLDGTSNTGLSTADSSDWAFGSGDFTMEMWIYPTSSATQVLLCKRPSTAGYGPYVIVLASYTTTLYLSTSGTTWDYVVSAGTFTANTWSHLAYGRGGGSLYSFIGGVLGGGGAIGGTLAVTTNPLKIGTEGDGSLPFFGYLDDIRLTKGVCRYTANFTPPTSPFPDR